MMIRVRRHGDARTLLRFLRSIGQVSGMVAIGLVAIGCGGRHGPNTLDLFLDRNPAIDYGSLLRLQCPSVGMSRAAVQAAFGEPNVGLAGPDAIERGAMAVWRYSFDDRRALISLRFAGDTVRAWDAQLSPDWAPQPRTLSMTSQHFRQIADYMHQRPEIEPAQAYYMLRGCYLIGMDSAAVLVVASHPPAYRDSMPGRGAQDTVQWTFVAPGRGGGRGQMTFVQGRLIQAGTDMRLGRQ